LYIDDAYGADISGDIPVNNMIKSNNLEEITEKKALIFKKKWIFSNLSGISPIIFQVL
jgi:hypothetical protein